MANELTLRGTVVFSPSGPLPVSVPYDVKVNVASELHSILSTMNVLTASKTAIPLGDTVPDVAIFKHPTTSDPANIITIYDGASGPALITIKPGEGSGPVRLSTTTPYVQSATANVKFQYGLFPGA